MPGKLRVASFSGDSDAQGPGPQQEKHWLRKGVGGWSMVSQRAGNHVLISSAGWERQQAGSARGSLGPSMPWLLWEA